jgi:hypothetical protein
MEEMSGNDEQTVLLNVCPYCGHSPKYWKLMNNNGIFLGVYNIDENLVNTYEKININAATLKIAYDTLSYLRCSLCMARIDGSRVKIARNEIRRKLLNERKR